MSIRNEIIDDEILTIQRGKTTVLAGFNGVGKTTLARQIVRNAVNNDQTVVWLDGEDYNGPMAKVLMVSLMENIKNLDPALVVLDRLEQVRDAGDVRKLLNWLSGVAQKQHTAVLIITDTGKKKVPLSMQDCYGLPDIEKIADECMILYQVNECFTRAVSSPRRGRKAWDPFDERKQCNGLLCAVQSKDETEEWIRLWYDESGFTRKTPVERAEQVLLEEIS